MSSCPGRHCLTRPSSGIRPRYLWRMEVANCSGHTGHGLAGARHTADPAGQSCSRGHCRPCMRRRVNHKRSHTSQLTDRARTWLPSAAAVYLQVLHVSCLCTIAFATELQHWLIASVSLSRGSARMSGTVGSRARPRSRRRRRRRRCSRRSVPLLQPHVVGAPRLAVDALQLQDAVGHVF